LPITGEILTSHVRSIDTQARPIRYAGSGVPSETAQLVRAKLYAFITI
jgi:mRNA interferase MazF